ncbi:MAG TPA: hypothetical protein VMG40_20040 [Bryobacteraceae bacterium]|nr:hypothetical protein [Bryobacteraceae bacterium]
MHDVIALLLPAKVDNTVIGMRLPVYVFTLIAIVSTVRSCIHIFAPDGGAGSIAGMNLKVEGAAGIVFAFALWGSAQLVYAIVQLVVAFRYRSLVPFMYVLLIVEVLLRMLVGRTKPVSFAHTPPGAIGNWIMLPLAALMLVLSLWR